MSAKRGPKKGLAGASLLFLMALPLLVRPLRVHAQLAHGIADAAYALLNDRVAATRTSFFLYKDADSGMNHGFASGLFPAGTLSKIHLDASCIDDPSAANGCSTDATRLDRTRGTVFRVSFDPLSPGEFAGLNIEEPEHWGTLQTGRGYDLRGATIVVFDVRAPTAIRMQFGVGGRTGGFINIPQNWTTVSMPLSKLGLSTSDLADTHILFTVVTNDSNAPNGATVLLDNIRFEPVPTSQQAELGFPLCIETFGVLPLQNEDPGRVPIPSDQILRNLSTIYESSLGLLGLLARETPEDRTNARLIADTFDYALRHDNHGLPLPVATDGSVGLHNAYSNGDIALLNDQTGTGQAGLAGDVRLAGFSANPTLCGPSGFCLVLDGATGGNNAFAILALAAAHRQLGDQRYLDDAEEIGRWIVDRLTDATGTGFGGYYLGYPDEGKPKDLVTSKSIENNVDIFAAFMELAAIEQQLGHESAAAEWMQRANVAGDFAMRMFDSATGCFYVGTVSVGTTAQPGIDPTGPSRGGEVVNVFDFLDANTFTTLALATASGYRGQIDWRRPVQCVLDRFRESVMAGGQTFQGFNLVRSPTAGPNGIAWEFTGQAVVAMRFVDQLYRESGFKADAAAYLDQIAQAQSSAPFGDGRGLVASTLEDGNLLTPLEQCLSTPFQCIPERVALAAATWAIFAEHSINPFVPRHTISGHIRYYSSGLPVRAVTVEPHGNPSFTIETDNGGVYALPDLPTGSWRIQASKWGDQDDGRSALDAAYILQAKVGLRTLSSLQLLAGDVTGNGTVSALDAALILQCKVGILPGCLFPVAEKCGSDWVFVPVPVMVPNQTIFPIQLTANACELGAIGYDPLVGSADNQDFLGVLFGDVTGNWHPSSSASALTARSAVRRPSSSVRVGRIRAGRNGRLWLPLYTDQTETVNALEFELRYDATRLRALEVHRVGRARQAMLQFNAQVPGVVGIALASAQPIVGGSEPALLVQFEGL